MAHEYDKSSKWLIQHHGDAILRLAGIEDVVSWRPLQAELVQPRQLPDGLLAVRRRGESEDSLFILEIATYPEPRLTEQVVRDLMLVYLDQRQLPEVITLILRRRGRSRAAARMELRSSQGLTRCRIDWRRIELWTVPAEQLLQAGDVGLIPWVPLADSDNRPEAVVRACREAIERAAAPDEKVNLLAVTQVMTMLRYNDTRLLRVLGGEKVMIESPLIQELLSQTRHEYILSVLDARFGTVPVDVSEELHRIVDEEKLKALVRTAGTCPDLDDFRRQLRRASGIAGHSTDR